MLPKCIFIKNPNHSRQSQNLLFAVSSANYRIFLRLYSQKVANICDNFCKKFILIKILKTITFNFRVFDTNLFNIEKISEFFS